MLARPNCRIFTARGYQLVVGVQGLLGDNLGPEAVDRAHEVDPAVERRRGLPAGHADRPAHRIAFS